MTHALFFVQGCPTCGRKVQIRLEHLGKVVTCHHCRATFVATDSLERDDAFHGFGPTQSPAQNLAEQTSETLSSPWPFASPKGH